MYSLSVLYIRLGLMYAVVVEWRSAEETGVYKVDKQLTVEENHDCSSLHETLLRNELMIVICSLVLNVKEKKC